ncbi:MAG: RHS repeat-associated core domain-containing protein [Caldilineales bacterium]|nr:RHS repeat-associated core domain-containing protein [Caldilineales bacterium]
MHTYDAYDGVNQFGKGRRTGMTDGSGNTAWVYDARGRVTKETKTIGGTGGGIFVTEWGYDAADRVKTMKYPGGNNSQTGETVNHVYTPQGLLDTVIGSATYVGDTRYNALGQVTQRNLGSAAGVIQQHYNYTAAENFRLVSQQAGTLSPYNNRQNIAYAYDNTGNVLSISDAAAYGGGQTQTFSYDDLDRLSTAQASGSTTYGGYGMKSYGYDNAGNITNFEGTAFTYNDNAHKHAVTHVGGTQKYWYDDNGNVITRINGVQTINMVYDAENRLIAISGGTTGSYVYDGDGNRVKETSAGVTRAFVGGHFEWLGSTTKMKSYYYGGGIRVAMRTGTSSGAVNYFLNDHLGGTALTLDSAGNRTSELRYYPYGNTRYNTGSQVTTYRYTGQRWDSGTGLYFYNARWYDPAIGRFLAADTIVPQPGDPQSLNRYAYVRGNPIRYTDPTGHAECVDEECRLVHHPANGRPIRRGSKAPYADQSGIGLVLDWFFELGAGSRFYGPDSPLTRDIMNDEGVQWAREQYYQSNGTITTNNYSFSNPAQPIREARQWLTGQDTTGIGSIAGGYLVYIERIGNTSVFWIANTTSRESLTRLLGSGPIIEDIPITEYSQRLEKFRSAYGDFVTGKVRFGELRSAWPRATLNSRSRAQTGDPSASSWVGAQGWGGNLQQVYYWIEPLRVDGVQ